MQETQEMRVWSLGQEDAGEENGNPFQKYVMFLPTKGEIYVYIFSILLFFFFKGNLNVCCRVKFKLVEISLIPFPGCLVLYYVNMPKFI